MLKTYKVLEANLPTLQEMVNKINKRAVKIGQEQISLTIDKEYFEDLNKDIQGEKPEIVKFFDITVNAEPIGIEGYSILASINHTYEAGNIIKTLSDKPIPEKYKTIDGICEHCHTNRKRKETVLLQDANGKILQIGKSCLHDFLGYDINNKLSFMDLVTELEKNDFSDCKDEDSYKFKKYIDTIELLQIANLLIKRYGYEKTRDENGDYNVNSTKDRAIKIYFKRDVEYWDDEEKEVAQIVCRENYKDEEVTQAIDWLTEQENTSDYINNLQVLVKNQFINDKECGILCSLMTCYYKAMEKKKEKERIEKQTEQFSNEYVGAVGERKNFQLTFIKVFNYDTEYGIAHIYIFEDAEKHQYKWNSSNTLVVYDEKNNYDFVKIGDSLTLKGTIKAHEEYNGVKQTVITRCKIVS